MSSSQNFAIPTPEEQINKLKWVLKAETQERTPDQQVDITLTIIKWVLEATDADWILHEKEKPFRTAVENWIWEYSELRPDIQRSLKLVSSYESIRSLPNQVKDVIFETLLQVCTVDRDFDPSEIEFIIQTGTFFWYSDEIITSRIQKHLFRLSSMLVDEMKEKCSEDELHWFTFVVCKLLFAEQDTVVESHPIACNLEELCWEKNVSNITIITHAEKLWILNINSWEFNAKLDTIRDELPIEKANKEIAHLMSIRELLLDIQKKTDIKTFDKLSESVDFPREIIDPMLNYFFWVAYLDMYLQESEYNLINRVGLILWKTITEFSDYVAKHEQLSEQIKVMLKNSNNPLVLSSKTYLELIEKWDNIEKASEDALIGAFNTWVIKSWEIFWEILDSILENEWTTPKVIGIIMDYANFLIDSDMPEKIISKLDWHKSFTPAVIWPIMLWNNIPLMTLLAPYANIDMCEYPDVLNIRNHDFQTAIKKRVQELKEEEL